MSLIRAAVAIVAGSSFCWIHRWVGLSLPSDIGLDLSLEMELQYCRKQSKVLRRLETCEVGPNLFSIYLWKISSHFLLIIERNGRPEEQ